MVRGLVALVLVLATAPAISAATIHGLVYEDANGDGQPSPGEPGVANAVVAFGIHVFGTTDASGQFDLQVPDGSTGIVWVRVPDGHAPGPVWASWSGTGDVHLGLRPLAKQVALPLTFVVASDSHIGISGQLAGDDLANAAREATALQPAPAFFTILGDVSTGAHPEQYDQIEQGLASLAVPFVPVPGNHDWYDGGVNYRLRYGPDNYSFDLGGVHFVVWNLMISDADIIAFLGADLAHVDPTMSIVAMTHSPPSPAVIDVLRRLGVSYVLTGHTHSNRIVDHGGVIELNTEPLLMGAMDFTPAGYRVVTIQNGNLTSYHRAVVDRPLASIVSPPGRSCTHVAGDPLVVAAALDAGTTTVTARIDCGVPFTLPAAGGWDFAAPLPALAPGRHMLLVDATSTSGQHAGAAVELEVCASGPPPPAGADWPQLGGAADHAGARAHAIEPPLAPRWTTTVGGQILAGTPAIAGGIVYIAVTDLGDGAAGGIVALDLATGAVRWRATTPVPVRGGVAVSGGLVIAGEIDGTVLGLDAGTGAVRWRHALAPDVSEQVRGWLYGPPTADDHGDVLVGVQSELADLDVTTGLPRWTATPVAAPTAYTQSLAAIAIGGGLAIGELDRSVGGLIAWDRATGAERWRIDNSSTIAIEASPVVANGSVFVENAAAQVLALGLDGGSRWQVSLDPAGNDWSYETVGTPAYASGVLVVPTLDRDLVGLDAATGAVLWRLAGTPSPLRTTHYRGAAQAGFEASPVITGDVVWAADTAGQLTAATLATGAPRWQTSLGVPVLAGLAASGDWLVVASYDGTVRALTPAVRELPAIVAGNCNRSSGPERGCDASRAPESPVLPMLLVIALVAWRRRAA